MEQKAFTSFKMVNANKCWFLLCSNRLKKSIETHYMKPMKQNDDKLSDEALFWNIFEQL